MVLQMWNVPFKNDSEEVQRVSACKVIKVLFLFLVTKMKIQQHDNQIGQGSSDVLVNGSSYDTKCKIKFFIY